MTELDKDAIGQFWNLVQEYNINDIEVHLIDIGGKGHIELHRRDISDPMVHTFTSWEELPDRLTELLDLFLGKMPMKEFIQKVY